MKYSKLMRSFIAALLCVLIVATFLPNTVAYAAETGPCTLRIEYLDGKAPISGVTFRVYRVADLLEHGKYRYAGGFTGCTTELKSQMTNAEWVSAAQALFSYVRTNNISADMSGKTDAAGVLEFANIQDGLYLVEGDTLNNGYTIYTPQVFCAVVPDRDDDGNPVYNVTVTPKYEARPAPRFGDLVVTKTVTGTAGEADREWHFTVTVTPRVNGRYGDLTFNDGVASFTLKSGWSVRVSGLPAGTSYSVMEADANVDGYVSTWSGNVGNIVADSTVTAAFFNRKDVQPQFGNLVVKKTVTGSGDTERGWHFRVTLNSPLNGQYGDMYFTGGVCEFDLKHGESRIASNLPAGVSYIVEETDAGTDGYTTTSTGDNGQISANGTAEASFVNDLKPTTPPPDNPPPQTGDNSHLVLWLSLMAISAAGMALVILTRKKERPSGGQFDTRK